MEIFADLKGFEGLYKISTKGRVQTMGKGLSTNPSNCVRKIMKQRTSTNGYKRIKLCKEGRYYSKLVHRLVAETFLSNPKSKPQVNHRDGNKQNNCLENLEWCTASENVKHSFLIGIASNPKGKDHPQSIKINQLSKDGSLIRTFGSIKEVTRELGFNTFGIINCCKKRKRYKTAYGYKWEYAK